MTQPNLKYKRVLLKVSGEGLSGTGNVGLDPVEIKKMADEIAPIVDLGCQVGLVVGAGNLVRGSTLTQHIDISRATADQMGMVATIINALVLHDTLISMKIPTVVMSAFAVGNVCELFMRTRAIEYLEQGKTLIFAAGTGNPYCTTDTCASLRASEIDADVIIKATKVDGVYSDDPVKNPAATLYNQLTFAQVIEKNLKVMDHSAITMCRDNNVDIIVCNLMTPGTALKAVQGSHVGTLVSQSE